MSTDRIVKMTPPPMKNQWRTTAVTRKKILSRSKCFVNKEMMHNEDFLTEKIGNRKMCDPTKKFVERTLTLLHRYGKISTQTSKRGKVRIGNSDRKEEEGAAAAGEVDSDDDFEADMALELKERVQVRIVAKIIDETAVARLQSEMLP